MPTGAVKSISGYLLAAGACVAFGGAAFSWLVNVAVAVRHAGGTVPGLLFQLIPRPVYTLLEPLAVDMSTISTFLPMLFTGCVAWALAHRQFRSGAGLPWWVHHEFVPFFYGFPAFSFWAGLAGTLYGLVLGLPDGIVPLTDALSNLIVGFKTSIYSTLSGLLCAGLSVPVSALFRRYAYPIAESPSLADTIELLDDAVRSVTSTLQSTDAVVGCLANRFSTLSTDLASCSAQVSTVNQTINVKWFQTVLRELETFTSVASAQAQSSKSLFEFLEAAHASCILRDNTRSRIHSAQYEALLTVLSKLVENTEKTQIDRAQLALSLYEMANTFAPRNGAPTKGACR